MLEPIAFERLPAHAQDLRLQVRSFLDQQLADLPAPRRARSWMGFDEHFSRALAGRGWVGLTLPKRWGGAGLDPYCRFVVVEELLASGAPVSAHWIADRQSGPLIARFGSDIQKQVYLPKICQAQAFFCIGMSEPQAGSDLASIRARATPSGDGWRLSGQKIWTTNAHRSHYMIALVRTSGTAEDRHKGLSQFVIDLKAPGVTVRSIRDLAGDMHFNEVFFDQVELDAQALIGAEGAGWAQVNAELAFERSGPERIYSSMVLLDTWLAHIHARPDASTREHNVVLIGRILAQLAVLRAMSIGTTARLAAGESPLVESALMKDLGTQFEQDLAQWIADAISADDDFVDSELIETLAYTQQISPSFSLRGGTREILRGMIARGLGLR